MGRAAWCGWVVMNHLADEGIKDESTVPGIHLVKARRAAAEFLRALRARPTACEDPW